MTIQSTYILYDNIYYVESVPASTRVTALSEFQPSAFEIGYSATHYELIVSL